MSRSKHRTAGCTYEVAPDEPCSLAVVRTVAAVDGRDPADLPAPLQSVVDGDALDQLFAGSCEGLAPELTLSFPYYGYLVTVHADRTLQIDEQSGA